MSNEIEEDLSFNAGWSQNFEIQSVQDTWSASVASIALEIAEFDPRVPTSGARVPEREKKIYSAKTKTWVTKVDPFNDEVNGPKGVIRRYDDCPFNRSFCMRAHELVIA